MLARGRAAPPRLTTLLSVYARTPASPAPDLTETHASHCHVCGHAYEMLAESQFCTQCGTKRREKESPEAAAAIAESAAMAAEQAAAATATLSAPAPPTPSAPI